MKLKNKLKPFAMDNHIKKYAKLNAKNLEDIADMFAIDFAEWVVLETQKKVGENYYWYRGELFRTIELLYIFKKEKKL